MALITRTLLRNAQSSAVRSAVSTRFFHTSMAVAAPEQPVAAGSVSVSQEDFDSLKLSYKKLKTIKRSLSRNELSATFAADAEDVEGEEAEDGP